MTQLFLICPNCRKVVEATKDMQRWVACSKACYVARNPGRAAKRASTRLDAIAPDTVLAIYAATGRHRAIAERYQVSPHQVQTIKSGRCYWDITGHRAGRIRE